MALSKMMAVLCLSMLLVSAVFVEEAYGRSGPEISYGAIVGNNKHFCRLHPERCKDKPANNYNRGCDHSTRCRGGSH
ncbi:hypothetical protein HS088_TW10G00492 [Tripterygium wilfordii]|uniref:Uncharacterized protein n=1 Tax=Tripterygium wilfordii TaxID=458696 RepID=A0A7J7D577_TRIWF|nr:hypothetical protein HS088_TW10G00492 [Tripterygium wilfordii]